MSNQELLNAEFSKIENELRSRITGKTVMNIRTGEIQTISDLDHIAITQSAVNVFAKIEDKIYALNLAKGKIFDFDIDLAVDLTDYMNIMCGITTEISESVEEKKKSVEAAKRQKELQTRFENSIEDLNNSIRNVDTRIENNTEEFYNTLGFIAKHCKKISAEMPDTFEDWFVKTFGSDAERRVIDSDKITSGGYSMKWSLSLTIDLDTDKIPAYIINYMRSSKVKTQISNTAFIFELVDKYGFKFGKSQDLDNINKYIPETYRISFEKGYNA